MPFTVTALFLYTSVSKSELEIDCGAREAIQLSTTMESQPDARPSFIGLGNRPFAISE